MSEYFFGYGVGQVSASRAARVDKIARRHGASFVAPSMPEGPRFWFATPNRGEPFDRDTARTVLAAVQAELGGVLPKRRAA